MKLIAFIGNQTAGKTTAAKILETHYGWHRTRFAGPLRSMLRGIGLGDYELEGEGKNKPCALLGGHTPVYALQTLGTEWGRKLIGPNFWVSAWEHIALDILNLGGKVVVDDLRFPNEAEKILDLGGTIVRINRPGVGRQSMHESEDFTEKLTPHFEILNDGSFNTLETSLQELLAP